MRTVVIEMIENAVVLLIVVGTIAITDGRARSGRLLWPITYVALFALVVAVSAWAFLPRLPEVVRATIISGACVVIALMTTNFIIERRRRGWSNYG